MPVRIPTDASPQLQEALRGIERRLAALEDAATRSASDPLLAKVTDRLAALERVAKPAYGDEWQEMVAAGPQHTRGLTPDPAPNAGLGTERALHEDGTWRRVLDGLIQAIPEGVGRPTHAARVLEVLADLAVNGSLGASKADFRSLVVNGRAIIWPPPSAWMTLANDYTHNSSGNWLLIPVDTANEDTDSICSVANTYLVCKTAGVYRIWFRLGFAASATGIRVTGVFLNDTTYSSGLYICGDRGAAIYTGDVHLSSSMEVRLAVGDILRLAAYQNSGGNLVVKKILTAVGISWLRP